MPEQKSEHKSEQKKDRADYDGLWKDAIERFLPQLLKRVLPDLYDDIDFSVKPEFLSKELRDPVQLDNNLDNNPTVGNNPAVYVDELIRLTLKNGKSAWVILHIEVQGPGGNPISGRMFNYMTLIYAHHKEMPVALAILTSRRSSEVIGKYSVEHYGTKLSYTYNCFEVYAQDDNKMLESDNPFDLIFYAVKNASKDSQNKKYALLLKLAKLLASKGWSEDDRRDLFNFIIRAVNLTDIELQQKFVSEIKGGENNMAELTFVEKYFRDEGRAEGLAEGQQLTQHEIYKRLVDVYKVSPQEAAAMTGWNVNFSYGMN